MSYFLEFKQIYKQVISIRDALAVGMSEDESWRETLYIPRKYAPIDVWAWNHNDDIWCPGPSLVGELDLALLDENEIPWPITGTETS